MPILKNAKKALRASKRKALGNLQTKQQMRSSVKSAKSSPSQETVSVAYSRIDRAVKRGIIHKNKAARLKSQVSRLLVVDSSPLTEKKMAVTKSSSVKTAKSAKATAKKSSSSKSKSKTTKSKKSAKSASAWQIKLLYVTFPLLLM